MLVVVVVSRACKCARALSLARAPWRNFNDVHRATRRAFHMVTSPSAPVILVRSEDRDTTAWPDPRRFELRLPQTLRGVRRLELLWIDLDAPDDGLLRRVSLDGGTDGGDGGLTLVGGARGCFAAVAGGGVRWAGGDVAGGVAGGTLLMRGETIDRVRVSVEGAEPTSGLQMVVRAVCGGLAT